MRAIRRAAESFKRQRKDRESDINDMKDYSAKGVYEQRINSIGFVTTETYQDAMGSLKIAQDAIAKNKDIPDSQNAYMAENLMHAPQIDKLPSAIQNKSISFI